MVIPQCSIKYKLMSDNNIIEQLSKFKYLGIKITTYVSLKEKIFDQTSKTDKSHRVSKGNNMEKLKSEGQMLN